MEDFNIEDIFGTKPSTDNDQDNEKHPDIFSESSSEDMIFSETEDSANFVDAEPAESVDNENIEDASDVSEDSAEVHEEETDVVSEEMQAEQITDPSESVSDVVEEAECMKAEDNAEAEEKINAENSVIIESIAKLMENDEAVLSKMNELSELFTKKVLYNDKLSEINANMHKELQTYKDDLYFKLIKPIILEIIDLQNSIIQISKKTEEKPEEEQHIPLKTFYSYAEDITDILENYEVMSFSTDCGEKPDLKKVKIVKKVETDDESLHGTVVRSISCGYEYNGKIVVPEKVCVYVYNKNGGK